jgi:hypothetical protein
MIPRLALVLLLLCAGYTRYAVAALAVDSEESGNAGHNNATSPLTYSFTNTAGGVFCEAVVATYSGASTGVSIAVTYNSVSLSHAPSSPFKYTDFSEDDYTALLCLEAPATGSNTVSISVSQSSGTLFDILGCGISFAGATASSPVGTVATNTDGGAGTAAPTINLTGTSNGDIVLSVAADGEALTSATSPTILSCVKNVSPGTTGDNIALGRQATTGGTVTAAFATAASDAWGIIAGEIFKAAAGGGGGGNGLMISVVIVLSLRGGS